MIYNVLPKKNQYRKNSTPSWGQEVISRIQKAMEYESNYAKMEKTKRRSGPKE